MFILKLNAKTTRKTKTTFIFEKAGVRIVEDYFELKRLVKLTFYSLATDETSH